jgi:hypothetical protein
MKGLGETIEESFLVHKILRSLPDRFNSKVSSIEEITDLNTLTLDQLLRTLTSYEMRITKGKSTTREASFKAEKNIDSNIDDIEKSFVRRLKKGSGQYKVKIPFKCFNCGNIGHLYLNVLTKERIKHMTMKRSTKRSSIKRIILRRKDFV